jgi:hypothetical protein
MPPLSHAVWTGATVRLRPTVHTRQRTGGNLGELSTGGLDHEDGSNPVLKEPLVGV